MDKEKPCLVIEKIGSNIDKLLIEKKYENLNTYITQIEASLSTYTPSESVYIYYYLGTGKSALAYNFDKLKKTNQKESAISFKELSLTYMRKALEEYINTNCANTTLLLSIYTNYANLLESCGRVIEALNIYRKAILLDDKFAMSIGNYGRVLNLYAGIVNDFHHCNVLHRYAYQAMKKAVALKDINLHKEAREYFNNIISTYDAMVLDNLLSAKPVFDKYRWEDSEERSYRLWCLRNHLFLNPLNDVIEQKSAFAHDPLTITRFTEPINQNNVDPQKEMTPPKWFSMLNQLKEEYIYARFLCYEGSQKMGQLHYADKDVLLSNADYNYTNYSIRLEQLRSAFKILYSIFDQIGFFINEFWQLGYSERQADAANVFRREKNNKYPTDNIALTALRWEYCEFKEDFGDNKELKLLRNALEHKFVKIQEYDYYDHCELGDDSFYHISEDKFIKHVLRLLALSREGSMELVYAIDIEERKNGKKEGTTVNLDINSFDDEWKI